ncbi:MAG: DNA methyltransferase [Pseudomonadota bacterium]
MDDNTIICGDAITILPSRASETVDLVVTDPPYLCNYRDRYDRAVRNDTEPNGVLPVFPELYRVLKLNSFCISFCGWSAMPRFATAWERSGFKIAGRIVWAKRYASSSHHTRYCHEAAYVLTKGKPRPPQDPIADIQHWTDTGNRLHPTQKAEEVIAPLITAFSQPGDVVLDPFLGSGTTAVAAANLGRRYLGIELEPGYCDIARQRLMETDLPRAA